MKIASSHFSSGKLQEATHKRLQEMASHSFLQLGCQGELKVVGRESDPWTAPELQDAFQRVRDLAEDPARGNKVTPSGLEEAAVALSAENLEVFERLEREKTGAAEFLTPDGESWDVKSPLSPPPEQNWDYSPDHQLVKVRKDFGNGDKVLLNLTRLTPQDRDLTLSLFQEELSCDERGQVLIFTDAETLTNP